MRMTPSLAELGEDVRNIRRTRTGEMLLVLKKDVKNSSNVYSDLAQTVLGEGARLKALCPEVTIQCKDLDEFTTEDELKGALSNQCNGGEDIVLGNLHMRRVPRGNKNCDIHPNGGQRKKSSGSWQGESQLVGLPAKYRGSTRDLL